GHDGGRVGVHQDDAETFLAQGLAGLGAGIVELTRLADHDGAGAEDQNAFDVCTFWHGSLVSIIRSGLRWPASRQSRRTGRPRHWWHWRPGAVAGGTSAPGGRR